MSNRHNQLSRGAINLRGYNSRRILFDPNFQSGKITDNIPEKIMKSGSEHTKYVTD